MVLLLHEVTNNPVVKEFNWCPLDSFAFVFFLFLLQHQFNKQLLQLFVAVVDAELFKAVSFENFKSVDIQNANSND